MNAGALSLPPRLSPLHPYLPSSYRRESTGIPRPPRRNPAKHLRLVRRADRGHVRDALSTLDLMSDFRAPADMVTYSVLLRSCLRARDLAGGRAVHRRLAESGLELDSVVLNSLVTLYARCGDWETANSIFWGMGTKRDLVSWSTMISSAAKCGMRSLAVELFDDMLRTGFHPNAFCFSGVLHACTHKENFCFGVVVFGFVIKTGYLASDVCVGCAVIDMFARNGDLPFARKVFDALPSRNVVAWTLMITRYAQCGLGYDAIGLFLDMGRDGFRPDRFTMSGVISAITELGLFWLGRQVHSQVIRSGLAMDICIACSLVDMYAKALDAGSMEDSRKLFDRMGEHNVMSWTAIISGYVQRRHDKEAIDLFCQMIQGRVPPNHVTFSSILKACANISDPSTGEQIYVHVVKYGMASVNCVGNSVISMYAKSGRMDEAQRAFQELLEKNLMSYRSVVDEDVKISNIEAEFELIHEADNTEIGSSAFTFASLLSAAASIGVMSRGQQLHAWLLKAGFCSDQCVNNALISMYSRCGDIEHASQVFDEMICQNVVSWTSMIVGLAKHGYANRALDLFHEMVLQGTKPNVVTYIAVLSACSHAGLVKEGRKHFYLMSREHGIVPRMEHYACMVDLLGRSGFLEEAIDFIYSMPFKASALVWRALLGACRIHGDMILGKKAAKNILELEPSDPAAYVLLSNIYAATGQWENVAEVRSSMKEKRLTKEAGLSWIEIDNTIHEFHVGDTRHHLSREIYKKLDELAVKIKQIGYVPDLDFVLHDVEDETKVQYLFQHSEKIAVAFGLISTFAPRPIRVFKNLRICGDCHTAIKFISKVTGRKIILRDSNRFHCIEDGVCSCGEYW